jgi:hypothetical protein
VSYVKLDCDMLRSSTWGDYDARNVMLTALLMAEPKEYSEPEPQMQVRSLDHTGWHVPPGWYGFVPAAGAGIVATAGIEREAGFAALERLGSPDPESRSRDFDGRRVVRVDGGFVVLNFMRFREKDHTTAERSRRYREQKRARQKPPPPPPPQQERDASWRHAVTPRTDGVTGRDVTHAEANAEANAEEEEEAAASVSPIRIPMTAAWQPMPETLAAFAVGLIPEWAVTDLVARFRAHFVPNHQELSTDIEWNQRCSKWVFRDWGNPSRRPVQPKSPRDAKTAAARDADYQAQLRAEAEAVHAAAASAANDGSPSDVQSLTRGIGG